jgi:dienelactone hydrolase
MNSLRLAPSFALAAVVVLCSSGRAPAAVSSAQLCLADKHRAVAAHADCVLEEYMLAARYGRSSDFGACDDELAGAFLEAETRYGAACRTSGDAPAIAARDADLVDSLDAILDPSGAGGGRALACVLAKVKAAARRVACGEKAEGLLLRKLLLARDLSKCDARLASGFAKAEAGDACPPGGDAAAVRAAVEASFGEIEADLADLGTADFRKRGRFQAGKRTMTFVDSSRPTRANGMYPGAPARTLPVTIWYPANTAAADSGFAPQGGPFPLVIRAHGLGAFATDSTDLTEQLASRGMIVVAPDFPLSNLNTIGGPTILDLDQQFLDVKYLIDQMLALNTTPGSPFEGRIDPARIGAIGHSLGGATVLGAGYHPTLGDPRIDVVVALAPFACFFQQPFFGTDTTPLMILSGSGDLVTPPTSNQFDVFGRANAEKYLVSLAGGLHIGFANDFLHDDGQNADDVLACPAVLPPGAPRPAAPTFGFPPDFLGGAAAGVDVTGSTCEAVCPLPTGAWMAHNRQRDIELAAATAMFAKVFFADVSADRLITGRLDSENADVSLFYER